MNTNTILDVQQRGRFSATNILKVLPAILGNYNYDNILFIYLLSQRNKKKENKQNLDRSANSKRMFLDYFLPFKCRFDFSLNLEKSVKYYACHCMHGVDK